MNQAILLESNADNIDFMIHGIFSIKVFGQEVWITTSHACILIVMAIMVIFAIVANRKLKKAKKVPDGFQNIIELIVEMLDKGAVIQLEYGVEGFATPKHLVKEDGSQAQLGEELDFKVIEFNKDNKRIILSHSRIAEDATKAERRAQNATKRSEKRQASETVASTPVEKTTLGDLDALQALKEQLQKEDKK